jgi:hypothetical protein
MSLLLPTAMILLPLTATACASGRLSSKVITSPLVKMMSDKGGGGGAGGAAGALGSTGTAPAGAATAGAAAGVTGGAAGLAAAGAATTGRAAGAGVWAAVWAKSAGAAKARPVATARRRRVKADFMDEAPENGLATGGKAPRRTRRA